VLGLAFKAYDPDHLIGNQEALGITVALVATNTPGVEIGRRHLPSDQVFENGPTAAMKSLFRSMPSLAGPRGLGKVGRC
jgi:alkylation response protein AidB-like acyl-CoA dehydrogenase